MKKYFLFLIFIFLTCVLPAQVKFYRHFNSGAAPEIAPIIEKTRDGGFILCSSVYSNSHTWLFKYDRCGNLQWSKFFPGFATGYLTVCKNSDLLLSSAYYTDR